MQPTYSSLLFPVPATVLAAALVLCRIHGHYYARSFLEDYGVSDSVITELFEVVQENNHSLSNEDVHVRAQQTPS